MSVLSCPHCDHVIESTRNLIRYGNPINDCPACGKKYINSYCTEPALRPYKPRTVLHQFQIGASAALLLALAVGLIVDLLSDNTTSWICAGGTFLVGTPLCFLWCLLTRDRGEEPRLKCWQESDRRLRDPKYAAALKFYGYNVPPKYLPYDYQKYRKELTYPGATLETSYSFKKKRNPPPRMPNGSEHYF